jgi:hypothetical protein
MWAGHPLGNTYPVGFVNAFPTLYPLSVFAAFGAEWLVSRASPRVSRWAPAFALALPIAGLPFARDGILFLTRDRVLERELRAISRSLEHLPEHDVLVEGPHLQWAERGADTIGDPIEVSFPRGEYAYLRQRRGQEPAPVIAIDQLGKDGIPRPDARALVYVGSKLRSFLRSEIEAGVVPDHLEREALVDLRRRYTLEPVHEFEIETEQHPMINVRLGADRVARVKLGFYWLVPRDSATPR